MTIRPDDLTDAQADGLFQDQREANQHLVLAALAAQDQVDAAEVIERGLRETAEFRERLIAILGHDLRNPLSAILAVSQVLERRKVIGDDERRLLGRVQKSGQRMLRMISQLLEFTRARLGGGLPLQLAPTDLGELCREVVEELCERSIPIHVECDGNLHGLWDADRLAEVISNLAGNAVSHAHPGTTVVVAAYEREGAVIVEVRNEGDPIPPELLPVIFEAFRGVSGQTHQSSHLGLGLYIASEIVRAHGGTLSARCASGTTHFTVALPRDRA